MKKQIASAIISLFFSFSIYGQEIKDYQKYKVIGSNPQSLKITSRNNLRGKNSMIKYPIINEQSFIKEVQTLFFDTLKELGKYNLVTKQLKAEYDSLKTESYITLIYTKEEEIIDLTFHFSQSITFDIFSEKDIDYIYNKLKNNLKIKLQTNNDQIHLDRYSPEWGTDFYKKIIPITEYYKEYSKKKGYKKYVIKLHSNKYSPKIMNVNPIKEITGKQTMGEICINRIEIDSIISNTIKEVLKHRKKYDEFYNQLKDEFEKNKTLSNIAIWYNGYGKILHCSFYVSSVVLDLILEEEDFEAISNALEKITLRINATSQNGYTPWGDYNPEWKENIKYASIPMIRFQ